jgi:hypothetical protein
VEVIGHGVGTQYVFPDFLMSGECNHRPGSNPYWPDRADGFVLAESKAGGGDFGEALGG